MLKFDCKNLKKKEFSVNRDWMLMIANSRERLGEYVNAEIIKKLCGELLAIERIKESKGLAEEDDIKRGVEIMRKIRAK